MERKVKITYSAERADMAKLIRILCEAVHSCYSDPEMQEQEKAA